MNISINIDYVYHSLEKTLGTNSFNFLLSMANHKDPLVGVTTELGIMLSMQEEYELTEHEVTLASILYSVAETLDRNDCNHKDFLELLCMIAFNYGKPNVKPEVVEGYLEVKRYLDKRFEELFYI